MAGLIPIFLWWIYRECGIAKRRSALLYFVGGFFIAVLPNVYFLAVSPRAYLFGNLGFHAVRSHVGVVGDYPQKLVTLARVLAVGGPEANGVQVAILVIISLICAVRRTRPATRLAFQLTAALGLLKSSSHPRICRIFLYNYTVINYSYNIFRELFPRFLTDDPS